jgi:arylsulfatase A-like enzyme
VFDGVERLYIMETPIILLTIDALRNDFFDSKRFPQSYEYFEDFSVFENAYSHGVATPFSFPGIISGEIAKEKGGIQTSSKTIAESLTSHESSGFSNNPHLISSKGYDRGFDDFHHAAPPDKGGTKVLIDRVKRIGRNLPISDQLYDLKVAMENMLAEDGLPSPAYSDAKTVKEFVIRQYDQVQDKFVWAHFMDPHFPFDPNAVLPNSVPLPDKNEIKENQDNFIDNIGDVEFSLAKTLYEANVRYLDNHLSDLFHELRNIGIYQKSLIIVTSDHGELFGEHGRTAHPWDSKPYDELIQVPLLVKYPNNQPAENIEHIVSHMDIGATILKEESPEHYASWGTPLQFPKQRYPVSVSNSASRITGPRGHIIKERGRDPVRYGTVTPDMEDDIKAIGMPQIPHLSGEVDGVNETDTDEIKRRLENLGYK